MNATIAWVFVAILCLGGTSGRGADSMVQQDLGRPEHELFLLDAADAMKAYHDKQRVYPSRWVQLPMTFAVGLYHLGDSDVRPTVEAKERWKPRRCTLTYVINSSGVDNYRIEAVDKAGKPHYAISKEGRVEAVGEPGKPTLLARPRLDKPGDDPIALALYLVWEGSHGVYRDEHPGTKGNSVAEELFANTNQLDFYEEMRAKGNFDRELERRRTARLAGRLREDLKSRYPDLPDR